MVCNKCNIDKELSSFDFRKEINSYRRCCKDCIKIQKKNNYNKNKEIILAKNKIYIQNKKDWKKEYDKKRSNELRLLRNKQKLENYHYRKTYDVDFRLRRSLRSRLYSAIKIGQKCNKTMELVGCDIQILKKHLESKFKIGMNWDNYGKKGWEVDHIIPCSKFNLNDKEQQLICFNYKNLQPLWVMENILKSNKTNND